MVTSLLKLSFFDSGGCGISSSCSAGIHWSDGVQSLRNDPLETQKVKAFFYSMFPDFRTGLWKVLRFLPFVFLFKQYADEEDYGALMEWY